MKSVVLGVAPVFLCASILMTGRANARSSASLPDDSGSDSIIQTSICELLKDPLRFDGAMVQVRATVLASFEVFAVQDATGKDCETIWLSYEGGGPTASVSLGLLTPQVERPPVPLKRDRQFKRFQRLLSEHMYPRKREDGCIGCNRYEVTASLTGRLDAAREGKGFGHMNAYRARLVLKRVADLSTVDLSSNYDPMEFSTTPIAFPKGRLCATVIGGTGKPVNKAEVTLRLMTDDSPYHNDLTDWADEKGRVTFDDIPPGTYLAGVNLDTPASDEVPFLTTYFPGTLDPHEAQPLEVKDGTRRRIVIRLGKELERLPVPVRVIWPDGKPVMEANVWLREIRDPIPVVGGAVSHTDSEGLFDLIGLRGIDYVVQADIYLKPFYKPYCSEQIRLLADEVPRSRITLVLTREGDVCRHEQVLGSAPTD